MMKNERGFTIMELLVVIVIIGVLAAIGVPAYNNMTAKAKKTACDANKRTISTAVGMYYIEWDKYPANDTAPEALLDKSTPAKPYLDNAASLKCPLGGSYKILSDETNVSVSCGHEDDGHVAYVIK